MIRRRRVRRKEGRGRIRRGKEESGSCDRVKERQRKIRKKMTTSTHFSSSEFVCVHSFLPRFRYECWSCDVCFEDGERRCSNRWRHEIITSLKQDHTNQKQKQEEKREFLTSFAEGRRWWFENFVASSRLTRGRYRALKSRSWWSRLKMYRKGFNIFRMTRKTSKVVTLFEKWWRARSWRKRRKRLPRLKRSDVSERARNTTRFELWRQTLTTHCKSCKMVVIVCSTKLWRRPTRKRSRRFARSWCLRSKRGRKERRRRRSHSSKSIHDSSRNSSRISGKVVLSKT